MWEPCGICWGQRRIVCRPKGEGYRAVTCYGCLGLGEVLRMVPGTTTVRREVPRPRRAPRT